jgi:pimeloyl-ACP methyl ester carboxylesterase
MNNIMTTRLQQGVVGTLSALMPVYFGKIGARAFLCPRPNNSRRHWSTAFSGFECRHVEVQGHRIPVWTAGTGPLALLVHGWERDHFAMGGFVEPLLEAGYAVAALDLPAHGEAEGNKAPLPLLAQAIAETARLSGKPQVVIAHSVGAAMSVLAMEDHGLQPGSVALIASPRTAKDYALAQARQQGLSRRAQEVMVTRINASLGEPLDRYRVDKALASLVLPTLLVHAEDDAIVPVADARANQSASSAQAIWLDSGGHNRILGDSRMISQVIDWVKARTKPFAPSA